VLLHIAHCTAKWSGAGGLGSVSWIACMACRQLSSRGRKLPLPLLAANHPPTHRLAAAERWKGGAH
jgi:hypothetical protein